MQLDVTWLDLAVYCMYMIGCAVGLYIIFYYWITRVQLNDHLFSSGIYGSVVCAICENKQKDKRQLVQVLCTRSLDLVQKADASDFSPSWPQHMCWIWTYQHRARSSVES